MWIYITIIFWFDECIAFSRFSHMFLAKYEEIKSNQFCLQFQLSDIEINNQIKKAFNEFMHYDS